MSEQPRSVPPQQLGDSLGRRKRRNARPLPVPVSAVVPPEPDAADLDTTSATVSSLTAATAPDAATSAAPAGESGPALSLAALRQPREAPLGPRRATTERLHAVRPTDSTDGTNGTDGTPETAPAAAPDSAPEGAAPEGLADSLTGPTAAGSQADGGASEDTQRLEVEGAAAGEAQTESAPVEAAGAERAAPMKPAARRSRSRRAGATERAVPAPAKMGRPKSLTASSSPAEDHLSAATAVYVPLDVRDLVAERRRQLTPAPTTAEVVLRAIEAQYERLPQLVEEALRPETGSLFTFATPARRSEVKVQMGLRLTRGQLRTLDQVEQQVGASSRGQLVTLAVRAEYGAS